MEDMGKRLETNQDFCVMRHFSIIKFSDDDWKSVVGQKKNPKKWLVVGPFSPFVTMQSGPHA